MPDAADTPKGRASKPAATRRTKPSASKSSGAARTEAPVVRLEIYAAHAPATKPKTRKPATRKAPAKEAQRVDISEQVAEADRKSVV